MERSRLENYNRVMKRWDFMDNEETDKKRKLDIQQNKYLVGRKGMGSAAFDILNAQYEENTRGQKLADRDNMRLARDAARSKHMEHSGGTQYDPINGQAREVFNERASEIYNPTQQSPLGSPGGFHAGNPTVRSGRGDLIGRHSLPPGGKRTFGKDPTMPLPTVTDSQL